MRASAASTSSAYDWTGFYVGAFGGWAWTDSIEVTEFGPAGFVAPEEVGGFGADGTGLRLLMAIRKSERVVMALDSFNGALRPYVRREMESVHKGRWLDMARQGIRDDRAVWSSGVVAVVFSLGSHAIAWMGLSLLPAIESFLERPTPQTVEIVAFVEAPCSRET